MRYMYIHYIRLRHYFIRIFMCVCSISKNMHEKILSIMFEIFALMKVNCDIYIYIYSFLLRSVSFLYISTGERSYLYTIIQNRLRTSCVCGTYRTFVI